MGKRNGRLIGENGSNVNQEGSDEASTSSRQTNPTVEDETFPTASWQKLVDQEPDNDDNLADCATQSSSSPRLAGKETQDYQEPEPYFIHLDSVRRTFEEGHKCKNANIIFEEEQAKKGMGRVHCLHCNVLVAKRKPICKLPSMMVGLGLLKLQWISTRDWCMQHVRQGLVEREWQQSVTF